MSAVVYQSTQTNTAAASSVVVTKPVTLAVGDFMIGQITSWDNGASNNGSPATPAGWTSLFTGSFAYVFYKFADSSDVAATNFTFTTATATQVSGSITRWTNVDTVSPINASNLGSFAATTSLSVSGITPTVQSMFVIMIGSTNTTAVRTASTYAMVTSNPTWTEAYDFGRADNGNVAQAMAYAGGRTAVTATGNVTATLNAAATGGIGILALSPSVIRPTLFQGAIFSFNSIMVPIISTAIVNMYGFLPPIIEIIEDKWNNTVKHVSDWLNIDKSV